MKPDADWQRLSPLALVFLIVSGLQRQVRENLFLFAGAGAGAAFTDWLGVRELVLIVLAFVLISTLGAMIYHRRFRFRLEADAVRVRRGLIEQKELRVRFDRVQNIQLGQPFYYRPFGLVRFSLQTPGAADKEVELPGIPRALAETMRDRISAVRASGPAAADQEHPGPAAAASTLFAASPGRLFLHGLSSNQVWVIAGLFFYLGGNLLERFDERMEIWMESAVDNAEALVTPGSPWLLGLSVVLVFLLLLFGLSGLLALARYWRFELFERGDRLVATAGLFDRKEQTVRRNKVTGVMLRQSAVGRVLGCWSLLVRQTRSSDEDVAASRNAFLLPGLRSGDLTLSATLLPGLDWAREFHGISPRFRQFAWSRLLLGLVATLGVLALILGPAHWSLVGIALLAGLAVPALHLRFRQWGWARQERMLWVRRGLFGRRFDGFDLEKVQQARVTSSPYQRRHDLVSLELVLPHGSISLPFLPEADAAGLANLAVTAAEMAHAHRV